MSVLPVRSDAARNARLRVFVALFARAPRGGGDEQAGRHEVRLLVRDARLRFARLQPCQMHDPVPELLELLELLERRVVGNHHVRRLGGVRNRPRARARTTRARACSSESRSKPRRHTRALNKKHDPQGTSRSFGTSPDVCASSSAASAVCASFRVFRPEASPEASPAARLNLVSSALARSSTHARTQASVTMRTPSHRAACAYFAEVVSAATRCVHTPLTRSEAYAPPPATTCDSISARASCEWPVTQTLSPANGGGRYRPARRGHPAGGTRPRRRCPAATRALPRARPARAPAGTWAS